MQGWQYSKGVIYLRPIFRLTKLAFLRARATLKKNQSEHLEGWRKFILYKLCIMIWAVPSLHYGIVYTLLDSLSYRHGKLSSIVWTPVYTAPKISTETYKICIGGAQPHSVTETTPNNRSYWGCLHHGNTILLYWHNFLIILSIVQQFLNTVKPPCATTSCMRLPPINDRQSKTSKFSPSKPLVNNHLL